MSGEGCHEYSYDLSDSTSKDEIPYFSSKRLYSFEPIQKLSRSPSLPSSSGASMDEEQQSKAHELETHLGFSVENAAQWKQGEKVCAVKI